MAKGLKRAEKEDSAHNTHWILNTQKAAERKEHLDWFESASKQEAEEAHSSSRITSQVSEQRQIQQGASTSHGRAQINQGPDIHKAVEQVWTGAGPMAGKYLTWRIQQLNANSEEQEWHRRVALRMARRKDPLISWPLLPPSTGPKDTPRPYTQLNPSSGELEDLDLFDGRAAERKTAKEREMQEANEEFSRQTRNNHLPGRAEAWSQAHDYVFSRKSGLWD